MRSIHRHYTYLVTLAVLFKICEGVRENIFDDGIVDFKSVSRAAEIYIPTIYSENYRCRNHSLLYLEKLKELKLWATEMFDASTKFPSGLLYGSTYSTGNFDECLEVRVPYNEDEFKGKYCLVKFNLIPIKYEHSQKNIDWELDEYKTYYNLTASQKIVAYADSLSRTRRSEYHISFCLPSSCSHNDLKYSLESIISNYPLESFKLDVDVRKEDCQISKDFVDISNGDIIFGFFVSVYISLVIICSLWHRRVIRNNCTNTGKAFAIAKCFALAANTKKLLSVKTRNADGLDSIAGMKVISMFLIILGHRCMFIYGSPLQNPKFLEQQYLKAEAAVLLNGTIIVDTFFIISGFLASYLMLEKFDKEKLRINIPLIYFHRILRILPPYAVILAFYSTIFVKIGSGPFWQQRVGVEQERCSENWWVNLLFLNNYVNTDKICMFQSWYLDCDMHYFLITPFLIYLLIKRVRIGLAAVGFIIISSMLASFATVYVNNYDAILLLYARLLRDPVTSDSFKNIYIPSHMRASPYFLGILMGLIKYKIKTEGYKIPKHMIYSGWILSVSMILATVYSGFIFYVPDMFKHEIFTAFYSSIHHFTWSVCIGWMIIAVTEGHGGLIKPLLAWKPLIFMSRITYSAFLIHGAIQIYSVAIIRAPIHAGVFETVYAALGDIFFSYVLGFFASLFFEAPVLHLEKLIFGRKIMRNTHGNKNHTEENNHNNKTNKMVTIP